MKVKNTTPKLWSLRHRLVLAGLGLVAVVLIMMLVLLLLANSRFENIRMVTNQRLEAAISQEAHMLARITVYQLSTISGLGVLDRLPGMMKSRGGPDKDKMLDYCRNNAWPPEQAKQQSSHLDSPSLHHVLKSLFSFMWHKVTFNESIAGIELVRPLGREPGYLLFSYHKPWGADGVGEDCPTMRLVETGAKMESPFAGRKDIVEISMPVFLNTGEGLRTEWGTVKIIVNAAALHSIGGYIDATLENFSTAATVWIITAALAAAGVGLLVFWWLAVRITKPLQLISSLAGDFRGKSVHEYPQLARSIDQVLATDAEVEALREALSDLAEQVGGSVKDLIRAAGQNAAGYLAAGMAHQLKNFIFIVGAGSTQLAEEYDLVDNTLVDYRMAALLGDDPNNVETGEHAAAVDRARANLPDKLKEIHELTQKIEKTTKTMLGLARGQRGQGEDVISQVDLAALLQEVTEHLNFWLKRGIRVHWDLQLVPRVMGHEAEILLLVSNVIKNATESIFLKEGINDFNNIKEIKPRGDIYLRLYEENNHVVLEVEDNGMGFSEDKKEDIFLPFNSEKRHAGGTGLGLAICLKIVQFHMGTIEARGKLGEGATFTIRLPL